MRFEISIIRNKWLFGRKLCFLVQPLVGKLSKEFEEFYVWEIPLEEVYKIYYTVR